MLQNISENFEATREMKTQVNGREKIDYKDIASTLFTKQNIFVYILTFMISMVSLGPQSAMMIAPFGIALVASAISNGVPIAVVYIASLLGTGIKFGGETTLMYIITSVVLLLIVLIRKPLKHEDETEQYKLGGMLFASVILTSLIKMAFTKFYLYDILVSIILSVAVYIFYKIFASSLNVISQYGIKKVFSIEEVVGASLLVAIAVSALGDFSVFTFSIRNIVCIFIVLMLGWRNGILVGGVSGITVGIVLGIIGDGNPILVATYAISGMLAGMLNKFGKIGVIFGFVLGNIIIAYSANGGTKNIIMFQEILISAIGLLALPKRTNIKIEDIIPQTKLLPEAVGRIEESSDTVLKLNSISKTISDISSNYKQDISYEKNAELFEHEVIKAISDMKQNLLYDYFMQNDGNMIQDIFDYLIENDILTENGLISILTKHNIYIMNSDDKDIKNEELKEIREIIRAINSAFNVCKTNVIWQKKLQEKNNNMSAQLNNVKSAIDNIAEDITNTEKNVDKHIELCDKIKNGLLSENILIKDIIIKQENSGRYNIKAYTDICDGSDGTKCPTKKILKHISKALNEKFVIQDQKCGIRLNKNTCEYTFISDDKYIIQTGIAKAKKDGAIVSGDMFSQVRLGDGKYLLAISDGMGSGPDARKNSKIAISMLERLLSSGFDKDTSINLINSAIITANKEEMYATLDVEILDLYAGKMQLLKSGACPTYIKKNRKVSMIKSTSLPAGIFNDVKVDIFDKDLEDGNIIVICSDGIIESNQEYANRELWIQYLLEEIQTDSPERIADIILKEAIDNNMGKPKDDMSVIVAKIVKK